MFKQQFSIYGLAIFNVESGMHITVFPQKTTPKQQVLSDVNLKTELIKIFEHQLKKKCQEFSIRDIIEPLNNENTIYIAILK